MKDKGIIRNQRVTGQKMELSREFRKSMTEAEKENYDKRRDEDLTSPPAPLHVERGAV